MSNRFLQAASATVLAAVTGIVLLSPCAAAQTASARLPAKAGVKEKAWTPSSRTLDGQPDLQGLYTNASFIPLERPRDLGSKEFFTREEADAYEARAKARRQPNGPGEIGDVHYSMNQFGLDRGQATGVHSTTRTSLIVGPEGRIPPMLPAAEARLAARKAAEKGHELDGPENRDLSERCIMWPNEGPPMLPEGYNDNLLILQGDGYVAILQEMIHDVRVIPTDGRPHLPPEVRQLMGDSRGHWEGNTLVVDTTNFTDRTAFRGSSDKLHVVERFTRTDAETIKYEFTVSDPTTWGKSWAGEIPLNTVDGPLLEYACAEGNYGLANNLSGARATEAQAAQSGRGTEE